MEELKKALDYFIEYEWEGRLQNLTLNEKKHINITKEDAKNKTFLQDCLLKKKKEQLKNIINKINFNMPERKKQVLEKIDTMVVEKERCEWNIEDILFEEDYKYVENYPHDIIAIKRILQDEQMVILYPILASGKKKIPLACFEMEILDGNLKVRSYHLQIEALRNIIAAILGCEIPEVSIYMNDFAAFHQALTVLENPDFLQIVDMIDTELKAKFAEMNFESIWKYKNFNQWAITEELVLTMETFDDVMFQPFKEEIEEVRRLCEGREVPLLKKYLLGNNKRQSVKEIQVEFYDGSYSSEFSINEKQAKVISGYQNSQMLSVNGPPGTGKTTVLKEIIADNIVKKVKKLIDVWEEPWRPIGVGNQKVYESPFGGNCNYSMMIASTNNRAVDNIGIELLNEIEYFSEVVQASEEEYKGTLCARLGNRENMLEFRDEILSPLIDFLKNDLDLYDEERAKNGIEKFKKIEGELEEYKCVNSRYFLLREQICGQLMELGLFKGKIQEEDIETAREQINQEIVYLEKTKRESEAKRDSSKQLMDSKSQMVFDVKLQLERLNDKLKEKQEHFEVIQKKSQYFLIGKLMVWFAEKEYGKKEEIRKTIEDTLADIEFASRVKRQHMEDYAKAEKEWNKQKLAIQKFENKKKEVRKQSQVLQRWIELKENFQKVAKLYTNELQWDDSEYKFNVCEEITKKRNQMFLLALELTEWYIKKYASEIVHNLDKVYPDTWFKVFYRRDYRYDESYVRYLKAVWETVFLCFPVVTTTLHALDRKKFPMIPEIFDTLMIDEAGQALIHTAIGPLLRFRKAIFVGDIFQLEPIRSIHNQSILDKVDLPMQIKEMIDIDKNSVQHAADRGSEIFDLLNRIEVGIVLEEHRRCESAIVQFSNLYVYDSCLKIVKKDEKKEFLGKNFCMLDIRGVKTITNENESEVEACVKIVEYLTQIYGSEYKRKIGIITPYKNQARLLRERIPDVASGTVHVFQGQEKEVILMSMVVDNTRYNSGAFFVGNKPNFLNVAFTRAKKQLILVGNYEACSKANNYLSKAMNCLRKYGRLYSLYEFDITESQIIEENHLEQFWNIMRNSPTEKSAYNAVIGKYASNGMIAGPQAHYGFLRDILFAQPKSIKIISPWIMASVVNNEFLEMIRLMKEKHKIVKICFGYNKTNFNIEQIDEIVERDNFGRDMESHKKAIHELRNILQDDLKYCPPLHSKILIVDNEFMVIGSHNWLSNSGKQINAKDEMGCLIYDKGAIEFVNQRYVLIDDLCTNN